VDKEVNDTDNQGGEEQRRKEVCRLYNNTSMQKVNVIGDDGEEIKNDAVHDEHAEPERKDDDRAEDEGEDRLQEEVEYGEHKRDENERDPIAAQHKAGDP